MGEANFYYFLSKSLKFKLSSRTLLNACYYESIRNKFEKSVIKNEGKNSQDGSGNRGIGRLQRFDRQSVERWEASHRGLPRSMVRSLQNDRAQDRRHGRGNEGHMRLRQGRRR